MPVSNDGIYGFRFAPMDILDPFRFRPIAVLPRTIAFCGKRSFIEVTAREFHPAFFMFDGWTEERQQ
jgi:hypothetical protein